MASASSAARAWAASGAMALTGRPDAAGLVPPDGIVTRLRALGDPMGVDPLPLLSERAVASGLLRGGSVSCGGSARVLRARDDWIVVNLARDDDKAAVAAWLEVDAAGPDPWALIEAVVATRTATALVNQASLLGLPCARLGETSEIGRDARLASLPVTATRFETAGGGAPSTIVDLSSLWAGHCAPDYWPTRGPRSRRSKRPDDPTEPDADPLHSLIGSNAGKELVALDLAVATGVERLRVLIERADVVIEASRPRALRQMGIVAEDMLRAATGPSIWVSITGYGRRHERVAFGDDAAVAGGLVAVDGDDDPCFVADAVADPLAAVAAASAVTECGKAGGRWLVDVSMAAVAASVVGSDRGAIWKPAADHRAAS